MIGLHAFAAGKPVHGCCAGPGSGKGIICRFVFQAAVLPLFFKQGKAYAVNDRRRFALIPVHADAAGRRGVKLVFSRVVVLGNRIVTAKIPSRFRLTVAQGFIQFCHGPADNILQGLGNIAFCLRGGFIPFVYRIKPRMVFRIGHAFHRQGVDGSPIGSADGNLFPGHCPFRCARSRLCAQPGCRIGRCRC